MRIAICLLFLVFTISVFGQTREEISKSAGDLYDKEEYAAALGDYTKGLTLYPDDREFLLMKGNCLDRMKELSDAYEAFSYLIQKHPAYSIGYNQRGLLLLRVQEFELALKDLNQAVALAESDSVRLSALLNRGAVKFQTRDFEGTKNDLSEALKIDSLNLGVMNNLAIVSKELGNAEKAFYYLYKILEVEPENVGAISNIGFTYQELGRCDTAIHFFNKVIELNEDEGLGYSNRGYCYYKLGKLDLALKDVNRSLELYSSNAFAYRTRALIYIAQGKNKDACGDIDMALFYKFTTMYGDEVEELKKKYCQ